MTEHAGRAVFEVGIDDLRGNAQKGKPVTVYERGTTTLATLYTDRDKTAEAANPIYTNAIGNLLIYADPGDYDAMVEGVTLRLTVLPDWEDTVTTDQAAAGLPGHLADAVDAHDASAVSFVPTGSIAATDVQSALAEVSGDVTAGGVALSDHLADTADSHDASSVSFVPTGSVAATDVQAAIAEVASDADAGSTALTAHLGDGTDAHDAGAVSFVPTGTIAATDVQGAVAEVALDAAALVAAEAALRASGDTAGAAALSAAIAALSGTYASIGEVARATAAEAANAASIASEATTARTAEALRAPIASPTFTGVATAPSVTATGKTGATATPITLAGGTASGAPSTGTHLKGELILDDTGRAYYCSVAGTPGTWVQVGGSGTALTTTFTPAGNIAATNVQTALQELDTEKAATTDIAPLSNSTPLVASGVGTAGTANAAAREGHVHPLQTFTLPQPLVLIPDAVGNKALIVRPLTSQTANIFETQNVAGSATTMAINKDGEFGFPQYTGFPRFTGTTFGSVGLIVCEGVFQVRQNQLIIGTGSTPGGYFNDNLTWRNSELTLSTFNPGASSRFLANRGFLMPTIRLGTYALGLGAGIELDTTAAQIGGIIQAAASQTADLFQWRDSASAIVSRVGKTGLLATKVAAPVLADLSAGEVAWTTNGAGVVTFSGNVAGVLKTATLTLA